MKAITINNPRAQLIASRKQTLLVRDKDIDYRGDLLIRAGECLAPWEVPGLLDIPDFLDMSANGGCVVGVVTVVGYRPMRPIDEAKAFSFYTVDSWVLELENPRLLRIPFPVGNDTGIFDVIPPVFSELLTDEQRNFYYGNIKE